MGRGNIITIKQLVRDAEGAEKFMPSDVAIEELARLATLGLHFERIDRCAPGTVFCKTYEGRWRIRGEYESRHLITALNRAKL